MPDGPLALFVAVTNKSVKDWAVDALNIEGPVDDYDVTNKEVRPATLEHIVPLAFWRSVGHYYTPFAKETMMDELAEKAGKGAVDSR